MRFRFHKTAALLMLLPLPILVSCDSNSTGPIVDGVDGIRRAPTMAITPDRVTLVPGGTLKLDALLWRSGGAERLPAEELEWTSTDKDVVRSRGDGVIEALALGEVFITVTYKEFSADAWVLVTKDGRRKPEMDHR